MRRRGEKLKKGKVNPVSLSNLLADDALESVLNKLNWSEPDSRLHQRVPLNELPILLQSLIKEQHFEINNVHYQTTAKWIEKKDSKIKRKEIPQWIIHT